jgi:hypothetical protein
VHSAELERGIEVALSELATPQHDDPVKNLGGLTVNVDQGKAWLRVTGELPRPRI